MGGPVNSPFTKAILATTIVGLAVVAPVSPVPFEPATEAVPLASSTLTKASTSNGPVASTTDTGTASASNAASTAAPTTGSSSQPEEGDMGAVTVAQTETASVSQDATSTGIGEPEKTQDATKPAGELQGLPGSTTQNDPVPTKELFVRTAIEGGSGGSTGAPYAYHNATTQMKPTASIHPTNFVSNASVNYARH